MSVMVPNPPSTALLAIEIIILFFMPIVGLILMIYYMVEKGNYNRQVTQMYNQELQTLTTKKLKG